MYTLADYKKILKHAISKDPDAQLITNVQFINDSANELAYAYPWSWRLKYFSLDATSASNDLSALPADFAGVHVLHEGTITSGGQSMLAEIAPLRPGQPFRSHSTYRYLVTTTKQGSVTTRPTQTIKIFPAARASGTVEGFYLRSIAELSGDTDVFDAPPRFDVLLAQLVRARALVADGQPEGAGERQLYQAMLQAFIDEDVHAASNNSAVSGSLGATAQAGGK